MNVLRPGNVRFLLIQSWLFVVLIAYASTADPTWIPGIYDGADYDEIVGLVLDEGLAAKPPEVSLGFTPVSARLLVVVGQPAIPCADRCTLRPRSPPLA